MTKHHILPQTWPFPSGHGEDQRAADARRTAKGKSRGRQVTRTSRPPTPRLDLNALNKLDDAPY